MSEAGGNGEPNCVPAEEDDPKAEIHILDVGHGNAAVVAEPNCVSIIDAARGDAVLARLRELHKAPIRVANVVLSHSHEDHVRGLVTLLLADDVAIDRVHIKPDVIQMSERLQSIRVALGDARSRAAVRTHVDVSSGAPVGNGHQLFHIEVLSPPGEEALGITEASSGQVHDANSLSSVIRVSAGTEHLVLFGGDIDEVGLDHLLRVEPSPKARVLVFPHHGGRPGSKRAREFARRLTEAVQPELVVFSLGRKRHLNPREDIVQGIRDATTRAHIMCTQLSRRCCEETTREGRTSRDLIMAGEEARNACAGSVTVTVYRGRTDIRPTVDSHNAIVLQRATSPVCWERYDAPGNAKLMGKLGS